jgi:hypothetical protein
MMNGSTLNNDHGIVNPPMIPVNESMYGHREPQHPGYPPIQPAAPAYMHPLEVILIISTFKNLKLVYEITNIYACVYT